MGRGHKGPGYTAGPQLTHFTRTLTIYAGLGTSAAEFPYQICHRLPSKSDNSLFFFEREREKEKVHVQVTAALLIFIQRTRKVTLSSDKCLGLTWKAYVYEARRHLRGLRWLHPSVMDKRLLTSLVLVQSS